MAATATATTSGMAKTDGKSNAIESCTALLAEARKITIRLVDVNEHFICKLCNGYFRDAHKIKECAHTFCSGCIRYHFMRDKHHNSCPVCRQHLGAKPWNTLVPDPAIQGLADKLLPNYVEQEKAEERAFYSLHGFKRKAQDDAAGNGNSGTGDSGITDTVKRQHMERDGLGNPAASSHAKPTAATEKISFELHPQKSRGLPLFLHLNNLKQPRMMTDASFRINQLRKYVALKLELPNANQVEISCRGTSVGGEYSLAFVSKTIWRDPKTKMVLEYRRTLV